MAAFLRSALHSALQPMGSQEPGVRYQKTCHEQHGMCQKVSFCQGSTSATSFVKRFNRSLLDNSVKVGSLILATAEQTGQSCFFFLGVCLQKPTAHVLVQAEMTRDGICRFSSDEHGKMQILTSQKLFQRFLTDAGQPFRKVSMEVWKYFLAHRSSDSPCIHIETAECEQKFTVDLDVACEPRRRRVKLRFGLQKPKQKQTKTTVRAQFRGKTRQLKLSSAPEKPEPAQRVKASHKRKKPDIVQAESSSQSSQESDAESSESLIPRTNFEEQPNGLEQEEEDWNTIPISSQTKQEEFAAKKLDQEHESMKAEALKQVRSKGTFFSKEIGLDDAGVAVSARSKCFFCGGLIPKDAPRFSFHHSTLRPSNWVHAECVVPLVLRERCVDQARRRLGELRSIFNQASHSQSSGSADVPKSEILSRAIMQVLEELPA